MDHGRYSQHMIDGFGTWKCPKWKAAQPIFRHTHRFTNLIPSDKMCHDDSRKVNLRTSSRSESCREPVTQQTSGTHFTTSSGCVICGNWTVIYGVTISKWPNLWAWWMMIFDPELSGGCRKGPAIQAWVLPQTWRNEKIKNMCHHPVWQQAKVAMGGKLISLYWMEAVTCKSWCDNPRSFLRIIQSKD